MIRNVGHYRVKVRFKDPDNLPGSFQTSGYLPGSIVATVPGPRGELNWVLRLDEPIDCYDAKGRQHTAQTFLLNPNGLDDKAAMRQPPWDGVTKRKIVTTVLLSLIGDSYPVRIDRVEDYHNYTVINDATVILEGSRAKKIEKGGIIRLNPTSSDDEDATD